MSVHELIERLQRCNPRQEVRVDVRWADRRQRHDVEIYEVRCISPSEIAPVLILTPEPPHYTRW